MDGCRRQRVVIVGAGFGGLAAARALRGYDLDVVLVDRNNYHTFHPLLYQVAAAELEPEQIAYPVRSILRKIPFINFVMREVTEFDLTARTVKTADQSIPYDFLILAIGSVSNFFGVSGAAQCAFELKTLDHGIALRNHILSQFEHAAEDLNPARRQQALTFAIVGGGPTGIEFAGALLELFRGSFRKDYPMLDFGDVQVVLLEAGDTLLPGLPKCCRAYALARLRTMGVHVRLQSSVAAVTPDGVQLRDATMIPAKTVVWTAGVAGNPAAETFGLPMARHGRVAVLPTLQVPNHLEVYVIGDLAHLEQDEQPLPMIAPVAMQQGTAAARNILRQIAGENPLSFQYRNRGTMATIGRNLAVAHVGRRSFTGRLAWWIWLGVHLVNLIGFRNRLLVLINWAWDYWLYERAVRLILPSRPLPICDLAASGQAFSSAEQACKQPRPNRVNHTEVDSSTTPE